MGIMTAITSTTTVITTKTNMTGTFTAPPARTAGLHWSALYQPALLGLWPAELNRPTSCEKPPDRLRNALYETRYIALETEADWAEKIECKITLSAVDR